MHTQQDADGMTERFRRMWARVQANDEAYIVGDLISDLEQLEKEVIEFVETGASLDTVFNVVYAVDIIERIKLVVQARKEQLCQATQS